MSDRPENQPAQANTSVPEKSGCMTCLGVILLLAAVAGCLYYFIAKPAMEERGFDVQEKLDNAKIQAGETFDSVKEKFSAGSKTVAEKYTEFKETAGQIKNSETVEKLKDTADKIKNSEKIADTAAKVADTGSEIVENAQEGDSWY